MTCDHVITEEMIKSNKSVKITYNLNQNELNICLNKNERIIRSYRYLNMDVVVIEILKKDGNIYKSNYLLSNQQFGHEIFTNKKVIVPQYPKLEDLSYSEGDIKSTENYEITHLASTDFGSSGSPIFLENSSKVLGIHYGSNENKKENYGNF